MNIEMSGKIKIKGGYCNWAITPDFIHIYDLFVSPKYRGQGKAKYLLQRAIDVIRESGYFGDIYIVANPKEKSVNKDRLTSFYESMGLIVYDYYG